MGENEELKRAFGMGNSPFSGRGGFQQIRGRSARGKADALNSAKVCAKLGSCRIFHGGAKAETIDRTTCLKIGAMA